MNEQARFLKQKFSTLFEELLQSLPPGTAYIHAPGNGERGGDVALVLTPSNPRAAPIDARLSLDSGAYLTIDGGIVFEVPLEGKTYYSGRPFIEEIRAICQAVIAGRFKQVIVTTSSNQFIGARASIELDGKEVGESWYSLWPFLRTILQRKSKVHRQYESYTSPLESAENTE